MKNSFNKNIYVCILFSLFAMGINQYSWLYLFDTDGFLSPSYKIIFGLLDLFFIITALLFLLNKNNKRFLFIYVSNCVILIFGLIIIELYFGNWLDPHTLNHLNIIKDRKLIISLNGLYESNSDTVVYTRDEYGFRGNHKDISEIDILTIGGSTTDQQKISDGQTFQDVLKNGFKRIGKDVSVVNAGVDGQSTFGHMKNFDWWFPNIPNLKVKYYLFYVGINDFYKNDEYLFDDLLYEHQGSLKQKIKNIMEIIAHKSSLSYLTKIIEGSTLAYVHGLRHGENKFSTVGWIDQPLLINYENIMKRRLDAYEERLVHLCEKVQLLEGKLIFVTQSKKRKYTFIDGRLFGSNEVNYYDEYLYNSVDYYYMSKLLNSRTMKTCRKYNGICIDLDNELDFDLEVDFYDTHHNTPAGAEKIGKYLFVELRDAL